MDQFDLSHAGNRPFGTYSKGMKRKLTIAAGIIHNPKILFLDEPTTGIDVKSARQIRELILNLKREGKTILLTTHYIEEAERICDRIAFIVKGKIVKIDSVEGLVKNLEGGYKVRLRVKGDVKGVKEEVEESFRKCKLELVDGNSLLISSKEPMPLFPLIQLLDRKGIEVYEARELKASLEDIFVKITNAEALKQDKKEKVGM